MKYDYLKYWKIVKYYYQRKYNLSTSELDLILFLYSEKYFTRKTLELFDNILSWDKNRIKKMMDEGWILIFRESKPGSPRIYELSYKSRNLVTNIYKNLECSETIPTHPTINKMFRKGARFTDKTHRMVLLEMNKQIKEKKFKNIDGLDL